MPTVVAVTLVTLSSACVSTRYTPASSPWLTQVLDGGAPRYYVDGKRYDTMDDAMALDPETRALFKSGQSDMLWGGGIVGIGSAVMGLGATDLITFGSSDQSVFFGTTSPLPGIAVVLAGVGAMVGGGIMAASGQRKSLDALNMFNDHMFERWMKERGLSEPATQPGP